MVNRFERLVDFALQDPASAFATRTQVEFQALAIMSAFVNFFRISIEETPGRYIYPSTVCVLEAPSGSGKNAPCRLMKDLIFDSFYSGAGIYWDDVERRQFEEWEEEAQARLLKEVDDEEQRLKKFERLKKAFYNARRVLSVDTPTNGSYEGFAFDRAYLQKMGRGAPFVQVEEYGNKIMEMRQRGYLQKMFDAFIELVDNPTLGASSIKDQDGRTPESDGMGITCLFTLSSPNEKQVDTIDTMILQAVGRRGFLCRETLETLDHERAENFEGCYDSDELESFSHEINELFNSLLYIVKPFYGGGKPSSNTIPLTEGAKQFYKEVQRKNRMMYIKHARGKVDSDTKKKVATLIKDLDRKTLKVGALLAVFNHGEKNFEITEADLSLAGQYVLKWFLSSKKFFQRYENSLTERILAFVDERGDVSARDLWEARLFPGIRAEGFQEPIYDTMMGDVTLEAEKLGLKVEVYKVRKQDRYKLIPLEDEVGN